MDQFDGVFVCEDVSSIEFKDGLFYLTDDFGSFQIKRAMRPSTFFRCVRGAMALVYEFERCANNIIEFERAEH